MTAPDPLTPAQAGRLHQVEEGTVLRWIKVGVVVGGQRVRLAGYKVGGCWRVPRAALEAFVAACNPNPVSAPPPSPAALARRRRAATARLLATLGGD